ncbi:CHAT domain-containing protein [Micromonospora sp. WMMD882]|uniref:CHAT domain-containing protein n=1 Tax=Micromonospora sp. WMMD882 TaxID=3015151 RepID=UPI00248C765E|nr:CHAT domain-containing protein [Micromonospora sp. WMMD882]WBB78084.1 CHAT domain-containing protein [Micromonospora sp. WMMD882]
MLDEYATGRDPALILGRGPVADAARLVELAEPGSPERDDVLATAGLLHWYRYLLLPEPDDERELDRSLDLFAKVDNNRADLMPVAVRQLLRPSGDAGEDDDGHPSRPDPHRTEWGVLGERLLADYWDSPDPEVLHTAITFLQHAWGAFEDDPGVESRSVGHARGLHLLALARYESYRRGDDLSDLHAAVDAARASLRAGALDDLAAGYRFSHLSLMIRDRYERLARFADLDEAVRLAQAAVSAIGFGEKPPADLATNLGLVRLSRFRHDRHLPSLDEAVRWLELAAADDGRADQWSNLSVALRQRYGATRRRDDLDRAVAAAAEAVGVAEGHPDRARYLSNLALALAGRHEVTGNVDDLDRAVAAAAEAVGVAEGHPDRARYLSNLAVALAGRHEVTGNVDDLDRAVAAAAEAARTTPHDHPDRADRLATLAGTLQAHGRSDEALPLLREAARQDIGWPAVRLAAARGWARLAAERGDFAEAVTGFTTATTLVQLLVSGGLSPQALRFSHAFQGLTADAVASALHSGETHRALELWEQGRNISLERELQLRSDVTPLAARHPELADRFVRLRDDLIAPPAEASPDERFAAIRQADRRFQLAREWNHLLSRIRELPGFADFLRPPRAFDLLGVGDEGPVVMINVSRHRSDALLITDGVLEVVPLPRATPEAVRAVTADFIAASQRMRADRSELRGVLTWLWDAISGPVLARLGLQGHPDTGKRPRLWWCPAGEVALLPLHAAGREDEPRGSVPDLVISSYTPTLRALLQARQSRPGTRVDPRMVAVALEKTPGLHVLPAVERDLRTLVERFPGNLTSLTDASATRAAVLAAMRDSEFLHFACHAATDPTDPLASSLLLADGRLTVADLLRQGAGRGELAVLAACQTAATDMSFSDEPVHLASALQLAGYRHVVGTLWNVLDQAAAQLTEEFYAAFTRYGQDSRQAAQALDDAIRTLRHRFPDQTYDWLAYVHMGP